MKLKNQKYLEKIEIGEIEINQNKLGGKCPRNRMAQNLLETRKNCQKTKLELTKLVLKPE
jgi:hypothetical protein